MSKKVWMITNSPPKCKLAGCQKDAIKAQAEKFLLEVFKPAVLRPQPDNPDLNYIVDVSVRWHGAYLIFTSKRASPGPNAMSPFFEKSFARFGYFGKDNWSVWARRHNDQWMDLDLRLTLEGVFVEMTNNPWFNHG